MNRPVSPFNDLQKALAETESQTSCPISVLLQYNRPKFSLSILAERLFYLLNLYKSEKQNGILIYFRVPDHGLHIQVDEAVQKIAPGLVQKLNRELSNYLEEDLKTLPLEKSLASLVRTLGITLSRLFPKDPVEIQEGTL